MVYMKQSLCLLMTFLLLIFATYFGADSLKDDDRESVSNVFYENNKSEQLSPLRPRPTEKESQETILSQERRESLEKDPPPNNSELITEKESEAVNTKIQKNEMLESFIQHSPIPEKISTGLTEETEILIEERLSELVNKSSVDFLNGSLDTPESSNNSIKGSFNNTVSRLLNDSAKESLNESSIDSIHESLSVTVRWNCSILAVENHTGVIIVKNDSQLLELMSNSNSTSSCFLLYFYLQLCEFCSHMSVLMNTIGRVYRGLPVLAVDAYALTSITGRFGITGVPSLLLFYNGRPVAKFNRSRSLEHIDGFITNSTGLTANENLTTIDTDYDGPLVTKIEEKGDVYLLLSFICLLLIFILSLYRTDAAQNYINTYITKFKEWALHQKTD